MKIGFKTIATVVGLTLGATVASMASAVTVSGTACSVASVSGATACEGIFNGNNSNEDLDGLFGVGDWGAEFKIDSNAGSVDFAGTTLTVADGPKTWELSSKGDYSSLMFVLKGGPTFSAFLMDLDVLAGTWNNDSMLKGNGKPGADLSHWSAYIVPGASEVVPLPAAGWMLLAGVGGLAALRRRKKIS